MSQSQSSFGKLFHLFVTNTVKRASLAYEWNKCFIYCLNDNKIV